MKQAVSPEQLERIRRLQGRLDAAALATLLDLPKKEVEKALAEVGRPAWEGREGRGWAALAAALVLVLGWWAYRPTLEHHEFHFDDVHAIQQNPAIKVLYRKTFVDTRTDLSGAQRLRRFTGALRPAAAAIYQFNANRMVTNWSFTWSYLRHPFADAKDAAARDAAIGGFHQDALTIHLVNALLVLALGWLTLTAPVFATSARASPTPLLVATLAAVVFVAHPLQTQAITYLSQRAESLCATFYLTGLVLYALARRRSLGPGAGSAPWVTPLALGAAWLLLCLGALLATTSLLGLKGLLAFAALLALGTGGLLVTVVRRGQDERGHVLLLVGSFLAMGLGLLAKEVGATLPLAILVWDLVFVPAAATAAPPARTGSPWRDAWLVRALRTGWRERARYVGPWLLVLIGLALVGARVAGENVARQLLQTAEEGGAANQAKLSPPAYLLTQLNVFWTYVRLSLLPYGQSLDRAYPVVELRPGSGPLWLAFVSLAGLGGALALACWRGARARLGVFALLLALLVLAPSSSLIVLPDVIYEHRFYLPLAGLALLLAGLVERLARDRLAQPQRVQALVALTAALGLGLGLATRARNEVWASELSLWRDETAKNPDKPRSWTNLALAYHDREACRLRLRDGRELSGTPVPLPDGSTLLFSTLTVGLPAQRLAPGQVLEEVDLEGGLEPSKAAYERALQADPGYKKATSNLALVVITQGYIHEEVSRALEGLAGAAAQGGRGEEAARLRAQAEELRAKAQACFKDAERAYLRGIELDPDDPVLRHNLGGLYASHLENLEEAYRWLSSTWTLQGGDPIAMLTCADIQMIRGTRAYWAAKDAGQDGLAAARSLWEDARYLLKNYLTVSKPEQRRQVIDRVQDSLKMAEGRLAGAEPPRPGPGGR